MEDPPPSATWHPALRPETLDDASLYSPDMEGPRQVTLSWDDMIARTPLRSRAPTHSMHDIQQSIPESISEDHRHEETSHLTSIPAVSIAQSSTEEISVEQKSPAQASSPVEPTNKKDVEEETADVTEQNTPAPPTSFSGEGSLKSFYEQYGTIAEAQECPPDHRHVDMFEAIDRLDNDSDSTDAVLHEVAEEPRSPLELFPLHQERGDIDAAWGAFGTINHSNSFPTVPPPTVSSAVEHHLAHSQAGAVIQEEEEEHAENGYPNDGERAEDPWQSSGNDFTDGGDFFSQSRLDTQGPSSPPDDEARFEEGLPLVEQPQARSLEDPAPRETSSELKTRSESFGKELYPSQKEDFPVPEPKDSSLERKSTEQVLNKMHFSQKPDANFDGAPHPGSGEDIFFTMHAPGVNKEPLENTTQNPEDFFSKGHHILNETAHSVEPDFFGEQPSTVPGLQVEQIQLDGTDFFSGASQTHSAQGQVESSEVDHDFFSNTANEQLQNEAVISEIETPHQQDDLAAMWEAALGDDLLDDTVDPSSFFGDEDDGFLLEDDSLQPAEPVATREQSPQIHQGQTSFTTGTPSYTPSGFNTTAFARSHSMFSTEPVRPAVTQQAESFVDKAKGGYSSPYDLPMDISKPRRTPASRGPQVLSRSGTAAPPPPRRSDSVQSGYAATPTIPSAPPSTPAYNIQGGQYATTIASPQVSATSRQAGGSGFFEELPVTSKPRLNSSASRFMPPSTPQQAPPPASPYQQYSVSALQQQEQYQQPPPQPPMQPITSSQHHMGLVGPQKLALFPEHEPSPQLPTQPTVPSAVAGRYSPAPVQQSSQHAMSPNTPGSNQYAPVVAHQTAPAQGPPPGTRSVPPNPYATSGPISTIARPPSVPHQHIPPKPSPLRSASANQYRPGDTTTESPVSDPRPHGGVRRSSLLKHAQSLDELPSPTRALPQNQLGIVSSGQLAERTEMSAPKEIRPSYESSRAIPHMPVHHEVVTPGIPTGVPPASRSILIPPRAVESYSASQQAVLSGSNRVRATSILNEAAYVPPSDATAQDPLERWKGAPIFHFGFGGAIVTSFPTRIPRYASNSRTPFIKSGAGEVRVHSAKILPVSERLATFPGPLKTKSKKKDVLTWLHSGIASLATEHVEQSGQSLIGDDQKRHEEKIMLWKTLATLVEYDGNIDNSPQALDAIRKVLSPEASVHKDQEAVTQPLLPAITSPDTSFKPSIAGSATIDTLRQFLLTGQREKAVWHAVDQKLWGHAMLIASTMPRELWKQVAHEFVRNEVKPVGRNTESLAALYDVFAGNWAESVDELVPPSARAGLQMMSKNSVGNTMSSGLDGLNRWRETLNLILSNRTIEDSNAVVAMGQLLASYGRVEAAHICYIFAKIPGLFGGSDDVQSAVVLLGADHRQSPRECAKDTDSILLSEVFEFITTTLTATPSQSFSLPHLQAFKLHHAELLCDLGMKEEAQQYCDTITATLKASTNRSPYFHARLASSVDNLSARLRQVGKEGKGSWISRPNVDQVSGFFSKALSSFVAGDDDSAAAATKADIQGPFARINGNTPEMISRNTSPALGTYGHLGSPPNYNQPQPSVPMVPNSRYAPGASSYTPQNQQLQEQPIYGGYEPLPQIPPNNYALHQSQQLPQTPQGTQAIASPPRANRYSPSMPMQLLPSQDVMATVAQGRASPLSSDATSSRPTTGDALRASSALLSAEARSSPYQNPPPPTNSRYTPGLRTPSYEQAPAPYEPLSNTAQPRSYGPSPNLEPAAPAIADSYQPSAPMYGEYPMDPARDIYEQDQPRSPREQVQTGSEEEGETVAPNEESASNDAPSYGGYAQSSYGYAPPTLGYEPPTPGVENPPMGYEPPTPGYEPPSYGGDDPEDTEDTKSPRKKKSFMDLDDDDDFASRNANMKKSEKDRKDQEAAEAFKRAAEQDAKREAPKSGGGWFGGIFSRGGKEAKPAESKAHKVHLGEENAFVFDENLKRWVNKKAGSEDKGPSAPTPPPPKGPPSRAVSAANGPPGVRPPTSNPTSGPPNGIGNGAPSPGLTSPPPLGPPAGLAAGLAPPSRPPTGMSSASNASSVDDLIGPAQARKAGTVKKGKKRTGYVDVLAK